MPAQTPPIQPPERSRRSRRSLDPVALIETSFSPAEPVGQQDRPRRGAGDGGEDREAQPDHVESVEHEHAAERNPGQAGHERPDVGPAVQALPAGGLAGRGAGRVPPTVQVEPEVAIVALVERSEAMVVVAEVQLVVLVVHPYLTNA